MTLDNIEPKVIEIISNQLSLRDHDIQLDSRFVDDLGADSLDLVELIMEMEEEFDIEIPDDDLEQLQTVQNVVDYVAKSLAE